MSQFPGQPADGRTLGPEADRRREVADDIPAVVPVSKELSAAVGAVAQAGESFLLTWLLLHKPGRPLSGMGGQSPFGCGKEQKIRGRKAGHCLWLSARARV